MRTWPALRVSGLAVPGADTDASIADLVHAALSDHPVAAIEEVTPDEWQVFFTTADERHTAATAVASLFPSLSITPADVPDDDWAAKSQASLRAIRADGIVVAPPWDTEWSGEGRRIIILPSMGFGTGHHATTRLCLKALQQTPLSERRVLDVGTGSGVLAIAASLLGAGEVVGIDDDPDAIHAACDNLALNSGASVQFDVVDLRAFENREFGVVTANLTGGLLMATAERLEQLTSAGGTLVLSGLMASEVEEVLPRFGGSTVIRRADEDEWVCLTLERKVTS